MTGLPPSQRRPPRGESHQGTVAVKEFLVLYRVLQMSLPCFRWFDVHEGLPAPRLLAAPTPLCRTETETRSKSPTHKYFDFLLDVILQPPSVLNTGS